MSRGSNINDIKQRRSYFMEKKVRIKKLKHQDDVKRSWAAAYPLIEDFEGILPEELERAQSKLNPVEEVEENDTLQIHPSVKRYEADISEK
jgi:hypothetical protein